MARQGTVRFWWRKLWMGWIRSVRWVDCSVQSEKGRTVLETDRGGAYSAVELVASSGTLIDSDCNGKVGESETGWPTDWSGDVEDRRWTLSGTQRLSLLRWETRSWSSGNWWWWWWWTTGKYEVIDENRCKTNVAKVGCGLNGACVTGGWVNGANVGCGCGCGWNGCGWNGCGCCGWNGWIGLIGCGCCGWRTRGGAVGGGGGCGRTKDGAMVATVCGTNGTIGARVLKDKLSESCFRLGSLHWCWWKGGQGGWGGLNKWNGSDGGSWRSSGSEGRRRSLRGLLGFLLVTSWSVWLWNKQ